MGIVNAKDVVQMAMRIEQKGEEFYNLFSQRIDNENASELFKYLADEEKKHYSIFKSLLDNLSEQELRVAYPDEYEAYLQAYSETLVFNEGIEKQAKNVKDILSAFDFSIRRELDSIILYQDMKQYASEKSKKILDKIIEEERKHFVTLTNKKKELT